MTLKMYFMIGLFGVKSSLFFPHGNRWKMSRVTTPPRVQVICPDIIFGEKDLICSNENDPSAHILCQVKGFCLCATEREEKRSHPRVLSH